MYGMYGIQYAEATLFKQAGGRARRRRGEETTLNGRLRIGAVNRVLVHLTLATTTASQSTSTHDANVQHLLVLSNAT